MAALAVTGCGGGGSESSGPTFPGVASTGPGPLATAAGGTRFQTIGNEHALVITAPDKTVKRVGGLGAQAGRMNYPAGVAVMGSVAYVVERGNHRVQAFDAQGNSVGFIGQGQLLYPGAIAAGKTDLFVADSRNARIVSYSTSGAQTRVLGAGVLSAPLGMAVQEDGVIVADPGLRKVLKIGFDDKLVGEFATGLVLPWAVATDGTYLYVADVSRNELSVGTLDGRKVDVIPLSKAPANVSFVNGQLLVT